MVVVVSVSVWQDKTRMKCDTREEEVLAPCSAATCCYCHLLLSSTVLLRYRSWFGTHHHIPVHAKQGPRTWGKLTPSCRHGGAGGQLSRIRTASKYAQMRRSVE